MHSLRVMGISKEIAKYIVDINYEMSLKILKEKDIINKILNQFDFKDKNTKILMEEIRNISNNYINDKVK